MPSNSLEQEAMERVRRMYATFDSRPPEQRRTPPKPEPPQKEPPKQERPKPPEEPKQDEHEEKGGFLDLLMRDKDQSLIMLLLLLLMKDGADMNLMLALIYLLI